MSWITKVGLPSQSLVVAILKLSVISLVESSVELTGEAPDKSMLEWWVESWVGCQQISLKLDTY